MQLRTVAFFVCLMHAACRPGPWDAIQSSGVYHCPNAPMSDHGSGIAAIDPSDLEEHIARVAPFSSLEVRVDDPEAAGLADATVSFDVHDWGYSALPDCDPPATSAGSRDLSVPSTSPVDWSGQGVPQTDEYGPDSRRAAVSTDGTSFRLTASWTALAPDDGPLIDAGATPGEPIRLELEIVQAPDLNQGSWTVVQSFGDPGEVDVLGRVVTTGDATLLPPLLP